MAGKRKAGESPENAGNAVNNKRQKRRYVGGRLMGSFEVFNPILDGPSGDISKDTIAWNNTGIIPRIVGDGGFKFMKNEYSGSFFNWGVIELGPDLKKRTKNSGSMQMVFIVQSGAVKVHMHKNEFKVQKQGIWIVPPGNRYSIKNIGSENAYLFFAQAREVVGISSCDNLLQLRTQTSTEMESMNQMLEALKEKETQTQEALDWEQQKVVALKKQIKVLFTVIRGATRS